MGRTHLLVLAFGSALCCMSVPTVAQQPESALASLNFLVGDWQGEGGREPGQGTGDFSFQPDLQRRVLVRRNEAHYAATATKPAYDHTDLMVVYSEVPGQPLKAIYFDNEGHVIRYAVSVLGGGDTATFLSDASLSTPRFRLTYRKLNADRVSGLFEIAPPGKPEAFSRYLEWAARRR